jgi:hypothetical protein
MLVLAMGSGLNVSAEVATSLSTLGLTLSKDPSSKAFDLDDLNKHNAIEHDASLSRKDYDVELLQRCNRHWPRGSSCGTLGPHPELKEQQPQGTVRRQTAVPFALRIFGLLPVVSKFDQRQGVRQVDQDLLP